MSDIVPAEEALMVTTFDCPKCRKVLNLDLPDGCSWEAVHDGWKLVSKRRLFGLGFTHEVDPGSHTVRVRMATDQ